MEGVLTLILLYQCGWVAGGFVYFMCAVRHSSVYDVMMPGQRCCYTAPAAAASSLYWVHCWYIYTYSTYTPCMSLVSELEIRIYGVPKVHTACPCVFKHTCQSYMHIHNGWMTLNTCMPPLTPLSLPSVHPYIMLLIYMEHYRARLYTHTHKRDTEDIRHHIMRAKLCDYTKTHTLCARPMLCV